MHNHSLARTINGVVSAAMTVLLLVHAVWAAAAITLGAAMPPGWIAWAGVACTAAHVVLCIVTSVEQLTDTVRPPSSRKKRHLALKWVTGGVLAAVAIAHLMRVGAGGIRMVALLIVIVATALAAHICVGAKSLLKDLGIDRRWRPAVRAVAVVACTLCALAAVAVALRKV